MPRHRIAATLLVAVITVFLCFQTPDWPSAFNKPAREILNSTLGFQHIFAINLPARTDRRDALALAAALTGLDITWTSGVSGQDVHDRVLPGDPSVSRQLSFGKRGSWRAHMNVLQRIVDENITSALIIEDDADWDVRLKSQMQVFSQAAKAFTQPLNGQTVAEKHSDPPGQELPLNQLPPHMRKPRLTPYGDNWDVLWLGHCGTSFPDPSSGSIVPSFRVTIRDDETVPYSKHLRPHPFALHDALSEAYPPYTRVVHSSSGSICTQAYAVSQQGARKLLWQFGIQSLTTQWDLMLRDWCDGSYDDLSPDSDTPHIEQHSNQLKGPVCITTQPPLFSHHYGKGAASDITAPGGGYVSKNKEMTPYIRLSVRLNMERLVKGQEPTEQWKDDEPHLNE
ncbi:glycosyltransferase family 25 protein [Corynascus similis CBS 632.67]